PGSAAARQRFSTAARGRALHVSPTAATPSSPTCVRISGSWALGPVVLSIAEDGAITHQVFSEGLALQRGPLAIGTKLGGAVSYAIRLPGAGLARIRESRGRSIRPAHRTSRNCLGLRLPEVQNAEDIDWTPSSTGAFAARRILCRISWIHRHREPLHV